jgi:hypothetical protein
LGMLFTFFKLLVVNKIMVGWGSQSFLKNLFPPKGRIGRSLKKYAFFTPTARKLRNNRVRKCLLNYCLLLRVSCQMHYPFRLG